VKRGYRPARSWRPAALGIALVALVGLVVMGVRLTHRDSGPPPAGISDLNDIQQLQARFNEDAGSPRLVLLLSPT